MTIAIDRHNSGDFYSFDYLKIIDVVAPIPESEIYVMILAGLGLSSFASTIAEASKE